MLALTSPSQGLELDLEKAKQRMLAYAARTNGAYRRNLKKPKPCDSGRLAGKQK